MFEPSDQAYGVFGSETVLRHMRIYTGDDGEGKVVPRMQKIEAVKAKDVFQSKSLSRDKTQFLKCAGTKGCGYTRPISDFVSGNPRHHLKCPKCGKTEFFKGIFKEEKVGK